MANFMIGGSPGGGNKCLSVSREICAQKCAQMELWTVIAGISGFDEPSRFARSVPTYRVGGTS